MQCFAGLNCLPKLQEIQQQTRWKRAEVLCGRSSRRLTVRHRVIVCLSTSPSQEYSLLTKDEFDTRLSKGELHVAFVGMSNCGKSYRSSQLQSEYDFSVLCVDDEIERSIGPELHARGYEGIEGLAAWMGFPTDDCFPRNQAMYLAHEERITAGTCKKKKGNFALDTTGSVIYLSEKTRHSLRDDFLVVHLEAGEDMMQIMIDNFFASPKPVVWGDAFDRKEGEAPESALRRCYPRLLRERRRRYAELAHVTIPGTVSLDQDIDCNCFVQYLRDLLLPSTATKAVEAELEKDK